MCPTPTLLPTPTDFSFTFPPQPQWVRSARDAVRTALTPVAPAGSDLVELAALLTSELVTNAVTASLTSLNPAPVVLHGEWSPTGTIRILVHDQAPGLPVTPDGFPPPHAENGRGLPLIDLHATAWGICHHAPGRGKITWCTLDAKG